MQKTFSILFLFILQIVFSQSLKFQRIGIEQGLSQSSAMEIIQDNEGFLWIGTWDGLNRYDGYEFIHYKYDPNDSTSLSSNSIRSLFVDKTGDLWIGTVSANLNHFNKRERNFRRHIYPEKKTGLAFSSILQIMQDSSGNIWTLNSTVVEMIDPVTSKMTRILLDTISSTNYPKEKTIGGIVFIQANRLITITPNGTVLAREIFSNDQYRRILSNELTFYEDKRGTSWLLSYNFGVYEYDWNTGSIIPRFLHSDDPNSISSNTARSMFEDSKGNLWVGTTMGLNRSIRNTKGEIVGFQRYLHDPNNPQSISSNEINTIYEDRSGIIWIGTQIGLNKIVPQRKQFSPIPKNQTSETFYDGGFPIAMFEESDSLLWIGTKNNLYFYNPFTEQRKIFTPKNSGLLSPMIYVIHQDAKKRMWVGTPEGLHRYDKRTQRFFSIPFKNDTVYHNSFKRIYAIAEDNDGILWIGTPRGIIRFNPENGEHDRVYFHSLNAGEGNSYILSLFINGDSVWIGTNNQGLLVADRKTLQFRRFVFDNKNINSLSNNKPMSIHKDREGTIWVGTLGGGLNKVIQNADSIWFQRYQHREGIINDYVYGILEDDDSNLWLSTNKGLSKFYPREEKFSNFTILDGVGIIEFNQNSYHKGKSGYLYFGGVEGAVRFRPEEIGYNTIPSPIALTNFEIFNNDVSDRLYDDEIVLTYQQNFFSFGFAALCFEVPEKNLYAYKLEGLDEGWNYIGTRRFASFTNIDPGEYVFRVKGTNNDGVWNEEGKSVKITIIPPFWATTWFRTISLLFLFGSIVGGVRYSVYRKYRRQINELEQQKKILEERQRTRDKIARDLHDDLASTVGSAGLFIETAKRTLADDSKQTREYLDKTSSILNEAEEAMSDIVWSVSPKHDTLQSLVSRIKLVTTDLTRANGIGNNVEVKGNIDIPLSEDIRRGVYLIFKEGLNNCLKHSKATMIEVCIGIEHDRLIFHLKDNGVGFAMTSQTETLGGHGMSNIRKRAEEFGGEITITSVLGKGTEIVLRKEMTQLSH